MLRNRNSSAPEPGARPRQDRLLRGVPRDALLAIAAQRWAATIVEPFANLSTADPPDACLVPIDWESSIHNGMTDPLCAAPARVEDAAPLPALGEFTPATDFLADLPPEAAEAARYFIQAQRKSSSFKVWQTCWRLIIAYCVRWKRAPLPMSVGTAIAIILHMAGAGYTYGHIRNVRWTIGKAHRLAKQPDPTRDELFRLYLRSVAHELGTESVHRKRGILFDALLRIGEMAQREGTLRSQQEWTGINLQFFTVLRRENLVDLNIEDATRNARGYDLYVRRGKNHQTKSRTIYLGAIEQNPLVCPVATLDRWLSVLRSAGFTRGPIFRHLGPASALTEKRLSARTLTHVIKRYVEDLGLPPDEYATQSMRRGMITQALLNNVPQATIREVSGHMHEESLDPYFAPGAQRQNLSVAATYGVPQLPPSVTGLSVLAAGATAAQGVPHGTP